MWGLRFERSTETGEKTSPFNNRLIFSTPLSYTADLEITIIFEIENYSGGSNPGTGHALIFGTSMLSLSDIASFGIYWVNVGGQYYLKSVCGGEGSRTIVGNTPITPGVVHTATLSIFGMNPSGSAGQGSAELFLDGVSQGTSDVGNSWLAPGASSPVERIGAQGQYYGFGGVIYSITAVGDNYNYNWNGDGSDRSATGSQPILVDTESSNNAIGFDFPTDGSRWVESADPSAPSITLASTPVYGEAISGTYANFGGTPTGPLEADDGTRQADISISVDSNNETFTGTFPALPAAGQSLPAGSLPYPGSIDVTLPDPGE